MIEKVIEYVGNLRKNKQVQTKEFRKHLDSFCDYFQVNVDRNNVLTIHCVADGMNMMPQITLFLKDGSKRIISTTAEALQDYYKQSK